MAALDFPSSPSVGQQYPSPAVSGQPVYTWDGEKWTTKGGAIGSTGASDATPLADAGTGGAGSSTLWARGDHFHPVQDVTSFAPLNSPVFTGDPRAPTPATGDSDTSIATTAFVKAQGYLTSTDLTPYAPLADPTFTGDPKAPTPATADNDTSIATTAFVKAQSYITASALTPYAPLADPVFTGNPQAPTPATADNDTSIATTAFVKAQGYITGSGAGLVSIQYFTSTQTITIPAGASKAKVRMVGGGGGGGNTSGSNFAGSGGGGAYLEKYLSGLTPGNTLALTIGAAGAAAGAGGSTTLASGTQTITTLTAGGGAAGQTNMTTVGKTSGGTPTNGDMNVSGEFGTVYQTSTDRWCQGGNSPFGQGALTYYTVGVAVTPGQAGTGRGSGGTGAHEHASGVGGVGTAGLCVIEWYS